MEFAHQLGRIQDLEKSATRCAGNFYRCLERGYRNSTAPAALGGDNEEVLRKNLVSLRPRSARCWRCWQLDDMLDKLALFDQFDCERRPGVAVAAVRRRALRCGGRYVWRGARLHAAEQRRGVVQREPAGRDLTGARAGGCPVDPACTHRRLKWKHAWQCMCRAGGEQHELDVSSEQSSSQVKLSSVDN